ncbi:unnamed protein product [Camellia sinensis]
MATKQGATVSVRILVDEEKKRVVCAETGNDFVDILFGFLTLPMGTIVRLIRKHRSELGSMSNLYRSVEANFSLDNFWTNACMDMLLHPRTPLETICRAPARYFICSDLECSRKLKVGLFSNYANSKCKCGKLMNKEIFALTSASNASETDGMFVTRSTAYIVSDSFKITTSTPGALVELLRNTGIKDLNCLEERVVKVGFEEILNLLERFLVSKSPLTDVFLRNQSYPPELRLHHFLPQNIAEKATSGSMVVNIIVRKSDGKALCAEAKEDFVDLLFSFLTIPLANVVNCLGGDSSLGCIDNLYKSVKGLDDKWFVTCSKSQSMGYPGTQSLKGPLLNPGLASKFSCSGQHFQLEERTPTNYYLHIFFGSDVCSFTFDKICTDLEDVLVPLTLIDPKSPRLETSFGEFVKRPAIFVVSVGLVVLPLSGSTSSIAYLKSLDVPTDDIQERVINISKQEALNLLKASLITTSALNVKSLYVPIEDIKESVSITHKQEARYCNDLLTSITAS